MFVIRRKENEFVTAAGSKHSYTKFLQCARVWKTREEAEKERCGNETILDFWSVMGTPADGIHS